MDRGDSKSMKRTPMEDPVSWIPRIATKLHTLWLCATYPFLSAGRNLSIHYSCDLKRSVANHIKLGNSVLIAKDVWLNVPFASEREGAAIILDDGCIVARRSMISARNRIHLEESVILSPSVLIMDHAHGYEDVTLPIDEQDTTEGGRIRIERGCWIGHGAAIVCNGGELVLGRNSVVAANSLLTRSIPPYSVAAGNPARVIKQYDPGEGKWVIGSLRAPRVAEASVLPPEGTRLAAGD